MRAGLRKLGFLVDWICDGDVAERELRAHSHVAAVLDLGLPQMDAMAVLSSVRRHGIVVPVLLTSGHDSVPERILGLDAGADDYLVKPIDLNELGARLRALVRRAHRQPQACLFTQDVVLDPSTRSVAKAGAPVSMHAREFDLLHALMLNAGRALSREQLEQHLYCWGQEVDSNAVEVHVHHLRRKLGRNSIQTLRGVGYLMPAQAQSVAAERACA